MSESSFEISRTILDLRIIEWEKILFVCTLLVVGGVLVEIVTHRHEFLKESAEYAEYQDGLEEHIDGFFSAPRKPDFVAYVAGFIGIAMVVLGVAGELLAQSKAVSPRCVFGC